MGEGDPGKYSALSGISAYGATCGAWDQAPDTPWQSQYCPAGADWCHQAHNWCVVPWCYVDHTTCATAVKTEAFSGSILAYSYDTCGAADCYTGIANETDWVHLDLPDACPFDQADTKFVK